MAKKRIRINLLLKIIIAIILGIALAPLLPTGITRVFVTFNSLFANFLTFFIPILILTLVAPGIAELGNNAGKMLLVTVLLAYGSTVAAGLLSYITCSWSFPMIIGENLQAATNAVSSATEANELTPFFTISMPPFIDVMSALVLAFMLGLGMAFTGSVALRNIMEELRRITDKVITSVMIPLLPIYIFGIFLKISADETISAVIYSFIGIIAIIFAIHIIWLLILFMLSGAISKRNPLKMLANMIPAYMTALGTQSSAATIPVTLAQTRKNGVSEGVASFVIPLCATIHLSGSTLKIVACAYAVMLMNGIPSTFSLMLGFIMMLGITMVAAPGVPGGAIMAALGVLSSILGFDETLQALMIALYIAMDSFGTACNVTGDGAIAAIVERFYAKSGKF